MSPAFLRAGAGFSVCRLRASQTNSVGRAQWFRRTRASTSCYHLRGLAASSSNTLPTAGPSNIYELLDESASLLRRVASKVAARDGEVESILVTREQLKATASSNEVKPRVVVYGSNSDPRASGDLVTTLLEDPLSDDSERHKRIRDRWKDCNDQQTFEYSHSYKAHEDRTCLPSPWLAKLPISLVEIAPSADPDNATIISADIPILVLPPFPSSSISKFPIPHHPRAIVLVNASAGQHTSAIFQEIIHSRITGMRCKPRVLFVDVERALKAIDTLRKDSTSAKSIQAYQDDFLGSGFHNLIAALQETSSLGLRKLRDDTALSLAYHSLRTSEAALVELKDHLKDGRRAISELRERTLEECEKLHGEILGAVEEDGFATEAIKRAAKDVKPAIDGLKWWKLPLVVDDLTQVVSRAVDKAYTKEFQTDLVFQAGRLATLQASFLSKTERAISSLPPTFHSALIKNNLSQLSKHPSYRVNSNALLGSLQARLSQLSFPTNRLHRAAQNLLITTFSSTVISSSSAYWLWITAYLDGASALGAGTFLSLAMVRWAVGRWEKARQNWWQDWTRVGEGLGRDLKKELSTVLERQVFVVPNAACDGVETLVEKKKEECDIFEEELGKVQAKVEAIDASCR